MDQIVASYGDRITRGVRVDKIDRTKKWRFVPTVKPGSRVEAGDSIGYVKETPIVEHKILVPFGVEGKIEKITAGEFTVTETVATVKCDDGKEKELCMLTRWPVRVPRPYKEKQSPTADGNRSARHRHAFPIARGGVAAVPGPFGSGKPSFSTSFAKWADAQIIVYVGLRRAAATK